MSDSLVSRGEQRAHMPTRLLVALAIVSLTPVLALLLTALRPPLRFPSLWGDAAEPARLSPVWTSAVMWRALLTSLEVAVLTGVVATGIAFVAARVLARASRRTRRLAAMAAFLPVIAPPIALGVGVQVLAIASGLAGSIAGVLASHVVPATGYLTLYLLGVFSSYDHAMEDEARSLGATTWQVFARITWPQLRAHLVDAVALGALVSWGQLSLTLLVGGGVVRTLPVELLAFVRAGDDRLGAAAALMLTVPPLIALGLTQLAARRTGAIA